MAARAIRRLQRCERITHGCGALRPHCGEYGRGGRLGLATATQAKPSSVQALARIRALEAENAELKAKVSRALNPLNRPNRLVPTGRYSEYSRVPPAPSVILYDRPGCP